MAAPPARRGGPVVARDRSTEYTRALNAAAPDVLQVADRWHLLLNARQAAERWLAAIHGRLRQLPAAGAPLPAARTGAWERSRGDADVSAAHGGRWHAVYVEVRRRYAAGEPVMRIARERLARGTARRFAYAASYPERAKHPLRPSILAPYIPYLAERLAAGCENALQLWREIVARGVALVRRFAALVRYRDAAGGEREAALAGWLAEARASGVRALATFAAGLAQDGAAVRAALTTPWSNGQTEGHVTKLKLLKRQMYGRANFDLLRRRVLLAA